MKRSTGRGYGPPGKWRDYREWRNKNNVYVEPMIMVEEYMKEPDEFLDPKRFAALQVTRGGPTTSFSKSTGEISLRARWGHWGRRRAINDRTTRSVIRIEMPYVRNREEN